MVAHATHEGGGDNLFADQGPTEEKSQPKDSSQRDRKPVPSRSMGFDGPTNRAVKPRVNLLEALRILIEFAGEIFREGLAPRKP